MIETKCGNFEIVKDTNNVFNIVQFEERFCEILKRYEYIVGDYFQDLLRLKGFTKENTYRIPDYINEFCALDSQYYILRNLDYDPNFEVSED